jgi:hypothetical protein
MKRQGLNMNKISAFLTDHWKPIVLFYLIVNSYSKIENAQAELSKRIDKIEIIQQDVSEMKIMIEVINERTGGKYDKRIKRNNR